LSANKAKESVAKILFYNVMTKEKRLFFGSPDKSWGLLRLAYVLSHTDSADSTDF